MTGEKIMTASIDKSKVVQIGILVHDVNKAAETWASFLGVEVPPITVSDGYDKTGALFRGEPCDARLYQAFFYFDNIDIEIIQPVDDTPSIWRECLDRDGEGLHHISFRVKNMGENVKDCERMGYKTLQKGEYTGGRYAYMDALANLKIILEYLEDDDIVDGEK